MRLHLLSCFGFAALALVPACEGGQTGDLSGNNGPGLETGSNCDEHKQKLDGFDTMTDQGTAEAVMAYAEKSFDAPLTWKAAKDGQAWSVGPESGQGVIHLDVTRGANAYALTYTPRQQNGQENLGIGTICPPPQLGVDAHVEVTTDGGALAESYDTLLRTSTAGVSTLSLPLDLAKLKGDLAVTYSKPRAKLVQTSLEATLTAQGMTGTISGMEQVDSGSGPDSVSSASGAELAVWPGSAACAGVYQDGQGLTVPLEQEALGATGTDTLASVTPRAPVDIEWLDGTATKLKVTIASTGDGCFAVRDDVPIELDGGPTLSYPVTITLKSEDGRVDGSYSGALVVTSNGDQRRVVASATLQLSVTELDKTGFSSVQVPASSDSLIVEVDSKLVGGVASGSVSLFALASSPCVAEPPPMSDSSSGASAPGCAGSSETRLENAYWTN